MNLEVLVLVKGREADKKKPRSKDENHQQTQPTYNPGSGIQMTLTLPHFYSKDFAQIRGNVCIKIDGNRCLETRQWSEFEVACQTSWND